VRNRVNQQIKANAVRLIDEEGGQLGVVSLREAQAAAAAANRDLVEIQPNASPPVVRIMDYGKFVFQQNKQKAAAKKKQKQIKVKEIKFRPNTGVHDYNCKVTSIRRFLLDSCKVRVIVWFRGREMSHQELGIQLLQRVQADLVDCAKIDFAPKLEGKQLIMVLSTKSQVK
jgi:translation initiation factor IF-3